MGNMTDGLKLVFLANVWYGVYERPKRVNVYGDGFDWLIQTRDGMGMMPIERAMGWTIAKVY